MEPTDIVVILAERSGPWTGVESECALTLRVSQGTRRDQLLKAPLN